MTPEGSVEDNPDTYGESMSKNNAAEFEMDLFDALIIGQEILEALVETMDNAENYLGEDIAEAMLYITGSPMAVPTDYDQMQLYEALLTDRFMDLGCGVEDVNFYLSEERAGVILVVMCDEPSARQGLYGWLTGAVDQWEDLSPLSVELSGHSDLDDEFEDEDEEEDEETPEPPLEASA